MNGRLRANNSRPPWLLVALVVALTTVLGAMGLGIVLSREQSKDQILSNFRSKGTTSASFVSTFLSDQASRETAVARESFAGPTVPAGRFRQVVTNFGSQAAVLLDSSGRLLQVAPADQRLLGARIAPRYPHLAAAEAGRTAVSGVVPSAARHEPVIAIAVPYSTSTERRVFSVAYPVAASVLSAFVDHAVSLRPHLVLLVDASGKVIASSSHVSGATLRHAQPALASVAAHASTGSANIAGASSTFVKAPVAGTPWHLLIAVPNAKLFASIDGWARWLPWIVLAVIVALSLAVVLLYSRSLAAHGRLKRLSADLAEAAHTDALTGLANRRSLQERVPQAWAYAQRTGEALSVLVIDLDHFKQINDSSGHDAGDELLRAVAECMRSVFRASDLFGRWGGDEFLAFLPGTGLEGAQAAGERLREQIGALDLSHLAPGARVGLSFGCASAAGASPQEMIAEADRALYRAKGAGRQPEQEKALISG